ncbi:MAG: hypothetical protein IJG50_01230 [Clostridia bacterium]|nr:hypothetical protein [Clostridia bacterium]
MEIKSIDAFDLFHNGTIVLKTNTEELSEGYVFAWRVINKKNDKTVFKSGYISDPFISCKIKGFGDYTITAYVLNEKNGEKISAETEFTADKNTSYALTSGYSEIAEIEPIAEHISGPFWRFSPDSEPPKDAQFAWYIYKKGDVDPMHKQMFTEFPTYEYKFTQEGTYRAKLFISFKKAKRSEFSDWFDVVL